MKVKVVRVGQNQRTVVILKEEGDNYHFVDETGRPLKIPKSQLLFDSHIWVGVDEVYKILGEKEKYRPLREYLLKYRCSLEKEKIQNFLGKELYSPREASPFLEDEKGHTKCLIYRAPFLYPEEGCHWEVPETHLEFLQGAEERIVVAVLEEFGQFYLNGTAWLNYLFKCPGRRRKGRRFWMVTIDYDGFLRAKGGGGPFNDFSNHLPGLKKFLETAKKGRPLPPDKKFSNVVDLAAVREIKEMFHRIRESKTMPGKERPHQEIRNGRLRGRKS